MGQVSPFTGAFSFCSTPSANPGRRPFPQHGPAPLGRASPRPVSDTRTPDAGARQMRDVPATSRFRQCTITFIMYRSQRGVFSTQVL